MVNISLLQVFGRANSDGVDLIAHYINDAEPGWYWTELVSHHFGRPMQAFLPFMLISARAISYLLSRRLAAQSKELHTFEDWPFCEAFIPSVLAERHDFKMQELSNYAAVPYYTLNSVLHPENPRATTSGTIAHPVRVTRNIALGKPATQSSTHPWWNAISKEHDSALGNNGIIGQTNGFNTAKEINPWWQVDLLKEYNVVEAVIHNRIDAPVELLRLALSVSASGDYWLQLATSLFGPGSHKLIFSLEGPHKARYVRVSRVGFGELHLDEVEVFDRRSS